MQFLGASEMRNFLALTTQKTRSALLTAGSHVTIAAQMLADTVLLDHNSVNLPDRADFPLVRPPYLSFFRAIDLV